MTAQVTGQAAEWNMDSTRQEGNCTICGLQSSMALAKLKSTTVDWALQNNHGFPQLPSVNATCFSSHLGDSQLDTQSNFKNGKEMPL